MFFADFETAESQVTLYRVVRDFIRKLATRRQAKREAQYA